MTQQEHGLNNWLLRAGRLYRVLPLIIPICVALIVMGSLPIVFQWPSAPTADFFNDEIEFQIVGYMLLFSVLCTAIWLTARWDPERGAAKAIRIGSFVLLAALLTDMHYYNTDLVGLPWQMDQFKGVLGHTYQPPDQYRFLAQGTLWWILLSNGNFIVSYLAYRFLFTFLLCQSIYKFGRLYLPPKEAIVVVLLYSAFYPASTRYYLGNLIDPMSHAAILATLIYCHQEKFWPLLWTFVLGMFVKETTFIIVPCYWLLNAKRLPFRRIALWMGALVLAGTAVFFACRLPFHFRFSFQRLNRTSELMIYPNLGLAPGQVPTTISVFQRYLHPVAFIFMWLPFLIWKRQLLPRPLFLCALYLGLASYAVNLCFGWNYESRNFIPALIVLLTAAVYAANCLALKASNQPAD